MKKVQYDNNKLDWRHLCGALTWIYYILFVACGATTFLYDYDALMIQLVRLSLTLNKVQRMNCGRYNIQL